MLFFILCLIPLVIPFIAKKLFGDEMTWQEIAGCCVLPTVIMGVVFIGGTYSSIHDTQIMNGKVTSKERKEGSCRHDYKCRCYTTTHRNSNGSYSTTEHCSTCYDHDYDVYWYVHTSLGRSYDIDTKDRQGLIEPERWTQVVIGEPVSDTSTYINYIKGAQASLFNLKKYAKETATVPAYPSNVYDLWKINRVVPMGVNMSNINDFNYGIGEILKDLGGTKQVNVVMAVTNKPLDYAYAIRNAWLGGKKNDVVIVVGATSYPKIDWVHVFSWSKEEMVNVKIRDDLMVLGTMQDSADVLEIVKNDINKHYQRKSMSEFEYLKNEVEPSETVIWWTLIIGILFSIGSTWFCVKNDIKAGK